MLRFQPGYGLHQAVDSLLCHGQRLSVLACSRRRQALTMVHSHSSRRHYHSPPPLTHLASLKDLASLLQGGPLPL